jgi:cell wall-associated NlpC family hydrolase
MLSTPSTLSTTVRLLSLGLIATSTVLIASNASAQNTLPNPQKSSRATTPLASRSTSARGTITARVGRIQVQKAEVRASQSASGKLLGKVPYNTHVAILTEGTNYYGVMMTQNKIGWIAKSQLEMIPYQTEVKPQPETPRAAARIPASLPRDNSSLPDPVENRAAYLSSLGDRESVLISEAFTYMGVPYVWGGETRRGLDCSAFIRSVYRKIGTELPRVSYEQATVGQMVNWEDLQPGDRLYFAMKGERQINHCGLYLGNGNFIHASSNHHEVAVDSLRKPNYFNNLICARR